jgi:predicted acylesterase/phospholipase RssA
LFDKKLAEIIFKPLLEAKDLTLQTTLKEFYEYSNIDLHIFTFELNKFETVELSHTTHPDIPLVQALTMSSALPGIFMPTIIEDCCYLDGGVLCNFPLNQCLRDHSNKEEILGIKCAFNKEKDKEKEKEKEKDGYSNVSVTNESSLLEYVISISINTMNFLRDSVKIEPIDNIVRCYTTDNPLTLEAIQEAIRSQELRRQWIKQGEEDATSTFEKV